MKFLILLTMFTIISCSTSNNVFNKELDGFKYPFEVKTYELKSQKQKLKMRYMDIGSQHKKVLVLLHGKNFSGYYWERLAGDFLKLGYRVIIPDQIGFGKSSKPEFYSYSFPQLAINTKALLDHLKIEKYHIIGHSMGGMLAVNMAYMFSEVDKLFLINPIGLEYYLDYAQYKDPDFFFKRELNKTVDKVRNYQKKNYYDGKWNESYEELLTPFKGVVKSRDYKIVAWNAALTYGPIFSDNTAQKLKQIKNSTYLILGTRDTTGPGRGWKRSGVSHKFGQYDKFANKFRKVNSKIRTYELEGLGHMPHFEDYEKVWNIFNKNL